MLRFCLLSATLLLFFAQALLKSLFEDESIPLREKDLLRNILIIVRVQYKNTWLWNELLCLVRTMAITMNQTSSKKCGISKTNSTLLA